MAGRRQTVPEQIASVLYGGGLNRVGAAGILGNAYAESSWNPSSIGSGGGGLWGFTASPNSLADLQAYAHQRGRRWTDASLQTEFLLHHVSPVLIRKLNSAPSPQAAAGIFMSEWERPGIPRQSVRESAASKAFRMIGTAASTTVSGRGKPPKEPKPHEGEGEGESFGEQLRRIGLVGALVLGGAALIGMGATRMLGTAQRKGAT